MIRVIKRGELCLTCSRFYSRYIAADGLVIKNDKVLLIKRKQGTRQSGSWALPGGYLNWNESLEDCVLREIKEETGIKGEVIRLFGVYSHPQRDKDNYQNVTAVYIVKPLSDDLIVDKKEIEKADWFESKSLPKLIAFDHRKIIKEFFKIFKPAIKNALAIGVGVIIKKDKRILLLKRKGSHGSGQWSLPGGYLDFGESLKKCAVREVFEETGLIIKKNDLKFIALSEQMEYIRTDGKHCITVGFVVDYQGHKQPEIKEPDKCDKIAWFNIDNLPRNLFVPSQDNINNLKNNIIFSE